MLGVPMGADLAMPSEAAMISLAEQALDEAIEAAGEDPVAVERSVRRGRAGAAVLAEAESCEPDLIVVGTHGHATVVRVLLGSVSRYVAAHSRWPVAVVPSSASLEPPTLVRVGVDSSDSGRAALAWVAQRTACPLEVVHAWDVPHLYGVPEYPADDVERHAHAALAAMVDEVSGLDAARVHTRVVQGDPRRVLVEQPGELGAVVVGRRDRGPLGTRLGSVSMHVATHSPVAVIVVPAAFGSEDASEGEP